MTIRSAIKFLNMNPFAKQHQHDDIVEHCHGHIVLVNGIVPAICEIKSIFSDKLGHKGHFQMISLTSIAGYSKVCGIGRYSTTVTSQMFVNGPIECREDGQFPMQK